ncbi:MAG: hypothetical protein KAJ44_01650 [Thermoplasmatales archaeon]|nr:hypothetical protein [Thermoplasmatales archaeon]
MDKKDIDTMLMFMYNRCLRCEYKDKCPKKAKNIEELETAMQFLKNKELKELSEASGIKI